MFDEDLTDLSSLRQLVERYLRTLVCEMEAISDALRKVLIEEPLSKREEVILFENDKGGIFRQSRLTRFNNQILKCPHSIADNPKLSMIPTSGSRRRSKVRLQDLQEALAGRDQKIAYLENYTKSVK